MFTSGPGNYSAGDPTIPSEVDNTLRGVMYGATAPGIGPLKAGDEEREGGGDEKTGGDARKGTG